MSLSKLKQEVLAHYVVSSMTEEDMLSYFDCQSYEELPEEAKDFIDSTYQSIQALSKLKFE